MAGARSDLMAGPYRERVARVIEELQAESRTIFGGEQPVDIICDLIRELRYSVVARLRVQWNDREEFLYAKMPLEITEESRERTGREYAAHRYVYEALEEGGHCEVVRPVHCFSDIPALITEEVAGHILSISVRSTSGWLASDRSRAASRGIIENCGRWLRKFQAISPIPDAIDIAASKPYQPVETGGFVCEQGRRCRAEGLLQQGTVDRLLKYVASRTKEAAEYPIRITGMHSDLIMGNIFVSGGKVMVLDFGGFKSGPSCRDVATFLYSLSRLTVSPLVNRKTVDDYKEAFLDGYGWDPSVENVSLFRVFQAREILGGLLEYRRKGESTMMGGLRRLSVVATSERLLRELFESGGKDS